MSAPQCWLTIERASGMERRNVHANGLIDGSCPGCGVTPFVVSGTIPMPLNRDTYKSAGYCRACHDAVGWIYTKVDTLFGLEEDQAVLNGRARVY